MWHRDKVTTLSPFLSLPLFGLDQEQKQVWERACESGTGGVLANPSPLIAADASMLALRAAFRNSWCLARGFYVCFSWWFATYCVSVKGNASAALVELSCVRVPRGRGCQLLRDVPQWNSHFWNFQQQSDVDLAFFL